MADVYGGLGLETAEQQQRRIEGEIAQLVESLGETERGILMVAFNEIDKNRSGTIDPQELRSFLSLKWRQLVPQATVDSLVRLADVDHDTAITFDEFVRLQLRCMPLCRGYCRDCMHVILGVDGYHCRRCDPTHTRGMRRSFALCLRCWSKGERMAHEHGAADFCRFGLEDLGKDGVADLLPAPDTFYRRNVLKPWLDRAAERGEGYWGALLSRVLQ
eukprot:evm.model.scf_2049.1 EVM.evm.TU.scf_2049.1   scf_2049:3019-4964(-)